MLEYQLALVTIFLVHCGTKISKKRLKVADT